MGDSVETAFDRWTVLMPG